MNEFSDILYKKNLKLFLVFILLSQIANIHLVYSADKFTTCLTDTQTISKSKESRFQADISNWFLTIKKQTHLSYESLARDLFNKGIDISTNKLWRIGQVDSQYVVKKIDLILVQNLMSFTYPNNSFTFISYSTVGAWLLDQRVKKGYSFEHLSHHLNNLGIKVTTNKLWRIEKGKGKSIDLIFIFHLMEFFRTENYSEDDNMFDQFIEILRLQSQK